MKKMVIISLLKNVAIFYGEQIKSIFKDNIVIEPMSMEENNFNEPIEADIVLISTKSLYESVKSSLYYVDEILFARTSVSRKGYDVLETVPRKARALLVNNTAEASLDAITLIRQLGFKEIELFPYFPGAQYEEKFDFAITPNEMVHVPSYIKKVYDIGDRLLDLATLMDISICLGLDDYMKRPDILELTAEIVPLSNSFRKVMTDSMRVEGQLDVLFKYMSEGIITINQSGEILLLNEAAVHYLGVTTEPVLGRHIGELWSALPITEVVNTNMPINNKLVKYKGVPFVVDVYPIHELKRANGAVCIFKSFIESERKQHKLREQITGKGHVATYTFEDIAGQSDKMVNLRKLATHMAKSEASVLIFGESGTGKELFAQAIHNASDRKMRPFVAINCAALPESLLESELFGYEEGAFTGAKKGGKIGLFEMAHGGTLFLDELGEMPLGLQSRLLRVIQERKVMRLGGEYLIDVDVRIIAATNRKLRDMMKANHFRQDLYYRLNVLSLIIPPLRERTEDIPLLVESILRVTGRQIQIEPSVFECMKAYSWEGNIRELYNAVEYMCFSGDERITVSNLPEYVKEEAFCTCQSLEEHVGLPNGMPVDDERLVLECLYQAYQRRERIGRRQIYSLLDEAGHMISESCIRKVMLQLEFSGLIEIGKGRAGTKITRAGIQKINGIIGSNRTRI